MTRTQANRIIRQRNNRRYNTTKPSQVMLWTGIACIVLAFVTIVLLATILAPAVNVGMVSATTANFIALGAFGGLGFGIVLLAIGLLMTID